MYQEHNAEIYYKALERDSNKIELAEQLIASNDLYYLREMVKNIDGIPVGRLLAHIGSENFAREALNEWYEQNNHLKILMYKQHIIMYSIPALIEDDNIYLTHFIKQSSAKKLQYKNL